MTTVAMTVGEIGMTDNFFSLKHNSQIPDLPDACGSNRSFVTVTEGPEVTDKLLEKGYTWFFLLLFILVAPVILMNLLVSHSFTINNSTSRFCFKGGGG